MMQLSRLSPPHLRAVLSALLAGLLFANGVHAQKLEPGLWTMSTRTTGAGVEAASAQLQARMAEMTPQQRQMVEQMMAGKGIDMGVNPIAARVCISPEQAARAEPPAQPGCKHEVLQRNGEVLKMRFECTGPPASKGEGEYRLAGPKAYGGRMVIETLHDGKPQRMEMEQSGRWIGADCGEIKPHSARR